MAQMGSNQMSHLKYTKFMFDNDYYFDLRSAQLAMLSKFHVETLKRFIRTTTCAMYLLIGALPIEAELDKIHLNLLHNIMMTTND